MIYSWKFAEMALNNNQYHSFNSIIIGSTLANGQNGESNQIDETKQVNKINGENNPAFCHTDLDQ